MCEAQECEQVYKVLLTKESLKEWNKIDHSIQRLFQRKLSSIVLNPVVVNNRLRGKLSNCYKIKLKRAGYRLVYEVRCQTIVLIVWAVDKRDDEKVYDSAISRLREISLEDCTEMSL
jgi:mRNA interferase RelE/StbE